MSRYLIQDHRFIDYFLKLLGAAVNYADLFESRMTLGLFIGMISSDKNLYFLKAFQSLGVTEKERLNQPDTPSAQGLKNIMLEAASSNSYAATISVLAVAENIYFDWEKLASESFTGNFVPTKWITLHHDNFFSEFVTFLQKELNRIGPGDEDICRNFFSKTILLEKAFLDEVYM